MLASCIEHFQYFETIYSQIKAERLHCKLLFSVYYNRNIFLYSDKDYKNCFNVQIFQGLIVCTSEQSITG